MFNIEVTKRDNTIINDALRAEGRIPAVFYGAGSVNTPISVALNEFMKIWREAGETNTIKLDMGGETVDAFIHDVQIHPVSNQPIHVDFLVVDMNKKAEVSIPLEYVGVAPAVKNGLGSLVKVRHEVDVEALPVNLPNVINVDITVLENADSQITVGDITLPEGVTMMTEAEKVVASIVAQQEEAEEESAPVDLSSIEVEKKGKTEEESSEPTE